MPNVLLVGILVKEHGLEKETLLCVCVGGGYNCGEGYCRLK